MEEVISESTISRPLPGDDSIWIELLSHHRDVVARHRFSGVAELYVGRGYGNDLILDDPYVAARHLRIIRDTTGGWNAEDLGSTNGMFLGKQRLQSVSLDHDQVIGIGQSYLRLRRASHTVAPERVPQPAGRVLLAGLVLSGLVVAAMAMTLWLSETAEPKLGRYLVPLLILPLVILGWTGMWAILGRIFAGWARFESHLLIATATVLLSWLAETGGKFLAFALSWPDIPTYQYIVVWTLGGGAIYAHLWVIGPSRRRLKGGLVAALMVVGMAIQSVSLFDSQDRANRREVNLLPPTLRLAPLQSTAVFFADLERVRTKLDGDRRAAIGSDSDMTDKDEDEE